MERQKYDPIHPIGPLGDAVHTISSDSIMSPMALCRCVRMNNPGADFPTATRSQK
jgi:hypothetical protein